MQEPQSKLFGALLDQPVETISKKGFAEKIGVTPARVSQMIKAGLPVERNGRIHIARGRAWVRSNVDTNRRRAEVDDGEHHQMAAGMSPRAARDVAEARISSLKAERLEGRLIDRRTTERVVEARAKMEAEALIGWVNRVAPIVASETKTDLATVAAILDREIREHLISMAQMPVDLPK